MKIRELFVRLGVKADQGKLDNFDDAVEGLKSNLKDLVGWLAKVSAGIAGVVGAAGVVTQQTAEYGEEVLRNARSMAMSVERYQELQFGMNQLGASTDDFMDALSTLTDRAKDAEEGAVTYVREFERIGISVEELKGMKPGQIFERYVRAAVNAEDRTQAVTSAVRLLGDDLGRRIMPALTSSAESFEDFTVMAREAGIVLTEEQIVAAREAQHEWRFLKAAVVGFKRYLGMELMPMFGRLLGKDGFKGWFAANAKLMKGGIDRFARFLAEELEKVVAFATDLNKRVGGMQGWIELLRDAYHIVSSIVIAITAAKVVAVLGSIVTVAKSITGAVVLMHAQIVAVVVAVALMLLLIEDVWVYLQDGDSVVGAMADEFGRGNTYLDEMVRTGEDFDSMWDKIGDGVMSFFQWVWDASVAITMVMVDGLKAVLSVLFAALGLVFDLIGAFATFVSDVLTGKKTAGAALVQFWEDALAAFHEFIEAVFIAVFALIDSTFQRFQGVFSGLGGWIMGWAEGVIDNIVDYAVAQWKRFTGMIAIKDDWLSGFSMGIGGDKPSGAPGMGAVDAVNAARITENSTANSTSNSQKNINVNNPVVEFHGEDTPEKRREAADAGFKQLFGDVAKGLDSTFSGGER